MLAIPIPRQLPRLAILPSLRQMHGIGASGQGQNYFPQDSDGNIDGDPADDHSLPSADCRIETVLLTGFNGFELYRPDGSSIETWLVAYRPDQAREAARVFERWAADGRLSFSEGQADVAIHGIVRQVRGAEEGSGG